MHSSRKPLTSADGPQLQQDLNTLELQGRQIDTQAALRTGKNVLGVPALVPSNWQLVCRDRDGRERVLACHVATFELDSEDRLMFSTGYGAFALDSNGNASTILRDRLITDLAVL